MELGDRRCDSLCETEMPINLARTCPAKSSIVIAALFAAAMSNAHAQDANDPQNWSIVTAIGGYLQGNRGDLSSWLQRNGYGFPDPQPCQFDLALQSTCQTAVKYPRVSGSGFVGWMVGVRKSVTSRFSAEVMGASEQGGTLIGRCDDLAVPRDARCTNRFLTFDFGGGSIAALVIVNHKRFHVGAGPALLLADWDMRPSHLGGIWLDATYGGESFPLFARAQYRVYQSASYTPDARFSDFRPSTLFIGGGLAIGLDNSSR
jgi:opacity protein-like surface antigen